eukprot:6186559-Pleurochrysis_carterae.AAC.1
MQLAIFEASMQPILASATYYAAVPALSIHIALNSFASGFLAPTLSFAAVRHCYCHLPAG